MSSSSPISKDEGIGAYPFDMLLWSDNVKLSKDDAEFLRGEGSEERCSAGGQDVQWKLVSPPRGLRELTF